MSYTEFIEGKSRTRRFSSCPTAGSLAGHLFPHQRDLVGWALRKGRSAIFADTGLGKTAMQVEWARHVATAGRVLILAPLAVTDQTIREAARFGVDARYLRRDDGESSIVVTNYEMVDHFAARDFIGVVLDESSILKAYDGKTRNALITGFSATPYRLACTATPAPNDHTELGNHSEFLGVKTRAEMLAEYFVHDGGSTKDWRLKGHAAVPFWRWVSSWGAVVRRPSDLGHEDGAFALPELRIEEHVVAMPKEDAHATGVLFHEQARGLNDHRRAKSMTMDGRIEIAAKIASEDGPCIVWCESNAEADAATRAIPGAVQVRGSDSPEDKRDRLLGFSDGSIRVLVTKPRIAGFGLNWQHCNRMVFAGATYSYERTYQAIRRCWRFGQRRPVTVHLVRSDAEAAIAAALREKESRASEMQSEIVGVVADVIRGEISASRREWNDYDASVPMMVPSWITGG